MGAAEPVPLDGIQDWPVPTEITETTITFDIAGASMLEDYRIIGAGNTETAGELSQQVVQLQIEANHLANAGRGQRVISDMRKEILEEERKKHFWEKVGLYAGMLLLLASHAVGL